MRRWEASDRRGERGIFQQALGQPCQRGPIANGKQESRLFGHDQVAVAWDVGGDHGNAGIHRLHDRIGLALVGTTQPEAGQVRQQCGHVIAVPKEMDAVGDLQASRQRSS